MLSGSAIWAIPTMMIKPLTALWFTNKQEKLFNRHNLIGVLIAGAVSIVLLLPGRSHSGGKLDRSAVDHLGQRGAGSGKRHPVCGDVLRHRPRLAQEKAGEPVTRAKQKEGNKMEDILYTYHGQLYVNLTNQCPCACTFCIRSQTRAIGSAQDLWLKHDPSVEEVKGGAGPVRPEPVSGGCFLRIR